jgi:hypothetical protein
MAFTTLSSVAFRTYTKGKGKGEGGEARPRCEAQTAQGTRCKHTCQEGSTTCHTHGKK